MSQRNNDDVAADPQGAAGGEEHADLPPLRDVAPPREEDVEDATPAIAGRMDRGDEGSDAAVCAGNDWDEEEEELAESLRRQVEEETGETPLMSRQRRTFLRGPQEGEGEAATSPEQARMERDERQRVQAEREQREQEERHREARERFL